MARKPKTGLFMSEVARNFLFIYIQRTKFFDRVKITIPNLQIEFGVVEAVIFWIVWIFPTTFAKSFPFKFRWQISNTNSTFQNKKKSFQKHSSSYPTKPVSLMYVSKCCWMNHNIQSRENSKRASRRKKNVFFYPKTILNDRTIKNGAIKRQKWITNKKITHVILSRSNI